MIRIVAFLVAVIVVAAAATWISEPPGRVEIAWGDYMVETSPGILAAGIAAAAAGRACDHRCGAPRLDRPPPGGAGAPAPA